MAINSATDHGFAAHSPEKTVRVGDVFRLRCALGIRECRVLRAHRDAGYFETVMERWVTEVPDFRQGFVGSIDIMSREKIIGLKYAA